MATTDILAEAGGVQAIAQQLGISEADATRGAAALLPAILGGFKSQVQAQPESAGEMLSQMGGGALLDNLVGPQPTDVGAGNGILGQIFGSKDVSRTVAQSASTKSGLDPALLKRMLPLLAMLVTSYLARRQGGGGAAQPGPSAGTGGLGGMLGGILGGQSGGAGGLASMLDLDGDGNPLNDILKMAGHPPR
jgi:hypothetical protein